MTLIKVNFELHLNYPDRGSEALGGTAMEDSPSIIHTCTLSTNTFSVSYLSCRIELQIKNFMLTRLLVNRLLLNIGYIKIWVHLTFVK